ncbi:MAG: hypothetical protein ABI413_08010 [Ktedonobacteraceae bacterium]
MHNWFRCYRREVLERIDSDTIQSQGYGFQVEMAYRVRKLGVKIVKTPIVFMDRRVGQSKMSRTIVLEAFTYVLCVRFGWVPLPNQSQTATSRSVARWKCGRTNRNLSDKSRREIPE